MWLLLRWLSASTGSATPISEDRIYMYASYCKSVGKAATRLEQLLLAIAFCKGLIGLRGTSEILESARVSGAAHRLFMTKRILRQRAALKRRQCALLEDLAANGSGLDQVIAGDAMFCMHARARWSDAAEVTTEPYLDVADDGKGFIEAVADHSKTSGARRKRRRPIPLVGHAVDLSGYP